MEAQKYTLEWAKTPKNMFFGIAKKFVVGARRSSLFEPAIFEIFLGEYPGRVQSYLRLRVKETR
jgi:hypothetical protein